jgi:Protein of unknown function (DUF1493)
VPDNFSMQSSIRPLDVSETEIPSDFVHFLQNAGISNKAIKRSTLRTRLYHDMGLYGDTARWFVEELARKVDMSQFSFERYFPPEFYGENWVTGLFFGFVPFASARKRESYEPVTLGMVLQSLESGKWVDSDHG